MSTGNIPDHTSKQIVYQLQHMHLRTGHTGYLSTRQSERVLV